MLKFFNVYIEYEDNNESYTEPSENESVLLKNIMKYELFDINYNNRKPLKFFRITSR